MKKILSSLIVVASGVFFEFWLYTFASLLSINDFLFDQSTNWPRFFLLMFLANLFLAAFIYVFSKRLAKIFSFENMFIVNLVLAWSVSALLIFFFYDWLIHWQYQLIGLN